jgi:hypothetical protein
VPRRPNTLGHMDFLVICLLIVILSFTVGGYFAGRG